MFVELYDSDRKKKVYVFIHGSDWTVVEEGFIDLEDHGRLTVWDFTDVTT